MSKLKSFMEDWLDDCGHELGYDIGNLPDLRYLSWIKTNKITLEDYINMPNSKRKEMND
tara:strand:+ start:558 stop:734 length:177 start_codon:yes stop_codon:yes gene_type:complete